MKWEAWILVVAFILASLRIVRSIGKTPKAQTAHEAAISVASSLFFIWLLVKGRRTL